VALSSGALILAVAGFVIGMLVLVWIPVLLDRFMEFLTKTGPKFGPKMFFVGVGALVAGLVLRFRALEFVGAGLIGALVLGVILANY
jgi:hypothetical protein